MADSLDSLRHYAVVGSDDDDRNVSHLGTTCTHRGEGLVTWSIKECDSLAVRKLHMICTDVLSDTAGLTCDHIRITDVVEKRCLTMVNVTHHSNHRWSCNEIVIGILRFTLCNRICKVCSHELDLITELLGNKHESLGIETLVDGHHHTEAHAGADNLGHRSVVHKSSKVVYSHELRNLQHLLLKLLHLHILLHPLRRRLSLLLSVLSSEVALLALVHTGVSLLDLLLDFLLHLLLLCLSHCRLELVTATVATILLAVLALSLLLRLSLISTLVLIFSVYLVVCLDLSHVNLLAAALLDSLSLLLFLLVELRKIDLVHYLRTRKTLHLNLDFSWLRLYLLNRGLDYRFSLYNRLNLRNSHRLLHLHRFFHRCLDCYRFSHSFHWLCCRLLLELGQIYLVHNLETRFLRLWSFHLRFNSLRFFLRLLLDCRLVFNEHITLDDNLSLRRFFFLLSGLLLLRAQLNDFLELDCDLLGVLLQFQILTELRLDGRKIFIRHLSIRIHLHIGTLLIEELNESGKSDTELLCKFT